MDSYILVGLIVFLLLLVLFCMWYIERPISPPDPKDDLDIFIYEQEKKNPGFTKQVNKAVRVRRVRRLFRRFWCF